jgi:hypothetical protein
VRAVIRNLSPAGPEMRFDVLVAPAGESGAEKSPAKKSP